MSITFVRTAGKSKCSVRERDQENKKEREKGGGERQWEGGGVEEEGEREEKGERKGRERGSRECVRTHAHISPNLLQLHVCS